MERLQAITIDVELLEAKLKAHDWTYRMADDATGRIWERGEREERELVELAKRFPPREVARLVAEYAPSGLRVAFLRRVWPEVKA